MTSLGRRHGLESADPPTPELASASAYRALLDAPMDAITIADVETSMFVDSNRAASELFGYTAAELRGCSSRMLASPDASADVDAIAAQLSAEGRAWHPNLRYRRKDASEFLAELRISTFSVEGRNFHFTAMRDVTERSAQAELTRVHDEMREAHAQRVQIAKLVVIGQMAAGLAHEINSPAAWVCTSLGALRKWVGQLRADSPAGALAELERAAGMLDDSIAGMERIGAIVDGLRPFMGTEPDAVQEVRVDEVVLRACKKFEHRTADRARFVLRLGDPPPLNGDPARLVQMVAKLLANAIKAVEDGASASSEVVVETSKEDGAVRLAISDTGSGVPEGLRDRIFDPFVMAKPGDTDTGLDLALCAEIARRHRGRIRVGNHPPGGTVFEVLLPLDNGLVPAPAAASDARPARETSGGSRRGLRVLFVDDEIAMLRAYRRLFEEWDVTVARGGAEALERIAEDAPFDAIVCDLMMPDLDGFMVFDALRARAPELIERLLFVTGGAFTDGAGRRIAAMARPVLRKPFARNELEEAIRALETPPG